MKDYIKLNQKTYDRVAKEYRERAKEYIVSEKNITSPFINYLKKHFKSIKVLELGPGSGLALSYLNDEGFDTTAIDISKEIIKISRERSPKTKYIHSDFLKFDFGKIKFEGVFAKAFIHLFPKKDAIIVLRKIYNLLVSNGVVYLATTVHEESEEGFFEKLDYKEKLKRFRKRWMEEELIEEVRKIGFEIVIKNYTDEEDKNKKWVNLYLVKK